MTRESISVKIYKKQIRKKRILSIILNVVICFILFMNIYPFLMMIFGAFKDDVQFAKAPFTLALPLDFSYFPDVIKSTYKYVLNTIIVAFFGVLGNLFISGLSAYVFARMKFYGKEFLFYMVIALMMIPSILTLVPSYRLYMSLSLEDTLLALILPMVVSGPIFGTFLFRSFFEGINEEIFESARIDGCNDMDLFLRITVPMSYPIIGTLAIMNVVNAFNDVIWPNLINTDPDKLTIGAGLLNIVNSMSGAVNYTYQFAAYTFASLPMMILFIFATRFYIEGLSASGLKM